MRVLPAHSTLDLVHSPTAGTSLAATSEDGEQTPTAGTSIAQKFARMSIMSSNSGGSTSVWFDAQEPEGAEEFILDATPGDERENGVLDEGVQPNSPISQSDKVSSSDTTTDADTDVESETEAENTPETAPTSPAMSQEERQIVRRTELPSGPVGDEGSLFAVLKKNVGKVGSRIVSVPDLFINGSVGLVPSSDACVIQRTSDLTSKVRRRARVLRPPFPGFSLG